jgi:hypothetical protein
MNRARPEDLIRLRNIVAAIKYCGDPLTEEAVRKQFRYETGRDPRTEDVVKVSKR